MITYENIQQANESIQTTDIKGKQYAEVPQRIKAFRMLYPEGFIISEMLSNEDGVCIFQTKVGYYREDGEPVVLATGTAYEKEGSSFINKTSYIENCETSSTGRALGLLGLLGADATSVASAEEVQNAQLQQVEQSTVSATKVKVLEKMCKADGVDIDWLCSLYKVASLSEMNEKQFSNVNNNWVKVVERFRKEINGE